MRRAFPSYKKQICPADKKVKPEDFLNYGKQILNQVQNLRCRATQGFAYARPARNTIKPKTLTSSWLCRIINFRTPRGARQNLPHATGHKTHFRYTKTRFRGTKPHFRGINHTSWVQNRTSGAQKHASAVKKSSPVTGFL